MSKEVKFFDIFINTKNHVHLFDYGIVERLHLSTNDLVILADDNFDRFFRVSKHDLDKSCMAKFIIKNNLSIFSR